MGVIERIKRLPVIGTAVAVQRRYGSEGGGLYASAIAYHSFFSLFPLMLLTLAVLGFVLEDPGTQQRVMDALADAVPGLEPLVGDSIDALVRARAATGLIGLAGLAWTGTQVVRASGRALMNVWGSEPPADNPLKHNLRVLGALVALGIMALVSVGVSLAGGALPRLPATAVALVAAGVLIDVALFAIAYRVLLPARGPAFRALLPGAIFAAVGWSILKVIGAWYARRIVAGAAAVYGTFAGAIGILVLLSLGARLLLYGMVLNAVLRDRRDEGVTEMNEQHPAGQNQSEGRSTVRLVRDIADDVTTLVRKEVELARIEMMDVVSARIRAVAALGVAGAFGLLVLAFVGLAIASALEQTMTAWAARLVVAFGALVLAGGALLFARVKSKNPPVAPEETIRTVKEDVEWARAQLKR